MQGDMSQYKASGGFGRLPDGSLKILVATDIAAGVLDVFEYLHVINYDYA